jgi:ribosomal protein S18 acetylase RimI-like enzyme
MHVRAARPDDYDEWLRFWSYLGITGTPPPRERWVEHLAPQTIFLEDGGELVAYNLAFVFGDRGDVRQVAVSPDARRRGVGKALMQAVAAKLRAARCRSWRLEVRANNDAAIALYRSAGMVPHHEIHTVQMSNTDCERFAAGRSGMHAVTAVVPADDDALEAALDLGRGQIARWRMYRDSAPQMRVGTTAMVQVIRDFSPDFGLLFPFAAPDPDVAAHLIAAALPGPVAYEIQLTQAPIHAALLAAGATPREHLIEFAGAL